MTVVVDTGALLALFDSSEDNHAVIREIYQENPHGWILPWAILPEVDYLLANHIGPRAEETFLSDLSEGAFVVEWGTDEDLTAAHGLCRRYRALRLGLVDAIVIATAERLRADAIATLDLRHFGAVAIKGHPLLLPRDR